MEAFVAMEKKICGNFDAERRLSPLPGNPKAIQLPVVGEDMRLKLYVLSLEEYIERYVLKT